jgi:hypothetical protein
VDTDRDKQTVKAEVKAFANRISVMIRKHYFEHYPSLLAPTIIISWGRRYAKLVTTHADTHGKRGGQQSAYGFVDMTNGSILKAASWKQPAKHARGNIFGHDKGMNCCNIHGIRYL